MEYTHDDLVKAFEVWSKADPQNRVHEWLLYLDIREGKPLGHHEMIYMSQYKSNQARAQFSIDLTRKAQWNS